MNRSELIYDWNTLSAKGKRSPLALILDESLRDGLQSPSIQDPAISDKIAILHLMESVGINFVNIGLPAAGSRAKEHAIALAREIAETRMVIKPNCGGRTEEGDIRPIAEISQTVGIPIEAALFIGSSPIRRYAEDWTEDFLLQKTERAVKVAVAMGLSVAYVTEDTTRCDPEMVKRLYNTAISNGAKTIVICDTCGHATPSGAASLVRFVLDEIVTPSGENIRVDWHGHCDRGLAVANALAALDAGAHCVHACGLGIGERAGNTQMDQMLVNLKLMNVDPWGNQDLTRLKDYCAAISQAMGVPIPRNYPVIGDDAFRTGTGVHAAAVIKALRKSDLNLADDVYSGVPARYFGKEQIIEVGPMSGRWNVIFWLERHGLPVSDELVERVLDVAKKSHRILTEEDLLACCEGSRASGSLPRK